MGGFIILSSCNFPEAPVIGEILFKNNTVFIKNQFMNNILPYYYLSYTGPFNLTLDEIHISMHFESDPWIDAIFYGNDNICNPVDGITQLIKLTNIYLKSPLGNHEFRYISTISLIVVDIGDSRPFIFIVDNYNVQDIHN